MNGAESALAFASGMAAEAAALFLAHGRERVVCIGDAMIRLSVGLEDPQDLIDDLEQALR